MPNRSIVLAIPYPPSVNRIWRYAGRGRAYRSKQYTDFLVDVGWATQSAPSLGDRPIGDEPCRVPVSVKITVFPPDHRKRDLDNVIKAILDALTFANVWEDDSQVVELSAERGAPAKQAFSIVEITRLDDYQPRLAEDFGGSSKRNSPKRVGNSRAVGAESSGSFNRNSRESLGNSRAVGAESSGYSTSPKKGKTMKKNKNVPGILGAILAGSLTLAGCETFAQCIGGSCPTTVFNRSFAPSLPSTCWGGSCYRSTGYATQYSGGYVYATPSASYGVVRSCQTGSCAITTSNPVPSGCACSPCERVECPCEPVGACESVGACEAVETQETTEPLPACGAVQTTRGSFNRNSRESLGYSCAVGAESSGSFTVVCENGSCRMVPTRTPVRTAVNAATNLVGATYLSAVNAVRVAAGLRPLTLDARLETGSQAHAVSMSHYGALYHASGVAEICAQNYGAGIDGALTQWQNSPGHRALLMNPNYTRAGVGVYRDASGRNWCVMRFN